MSKTIEVIVDARGRTTVQTKGFAGPECREASRASRRPSAPASPRPPPPSSTSKASRPSRKSASPNSCRPPSITPQVHPQSRLRSPRMTLAERLAEHVRACFTGIYIRSHEHDDATAEIASLCHEHGWSLATWDVDRGLAIAGHGEHSNPVPAAPDPLAAIRSLSAMATPEGTALLVLRNFHRFLGSPEILQAVDTQIVAGKLARTFVVILSPVVQIPVELEKHFVVLEHELPGRDQLESLARGVATEPGELPSGDDLAAVLDASSGLTRFEAEGAFSLALVRHERLTPDVLWDLKGQSLKKSGLLTLHRGGEAFGDLGGLAALKAFCTRALRRGGSPLARPRGVLLLGVPGTGKSQFAKSLGNETGRPTLVLDIGALMGSLVGETERRVREALRAIDAMAPCVVFCDELEKALAGASSGQGDSGVSARLFGSVLSWLNDHESDVFFVGTCNDIAKLPPNSAGPAASMRSTSSTCPAAPRRTRSGGCTWPGSAS